MPPLKQNKKIIIDRIITNYYKASHTGTSEMCFSAFFGELFAKIVAVITLTSRTGK